MEVTGDLLHQELMEKVEALEVGVAILQQEDLAVAVELVVIQAQVALQEL
jgi:hypothetical protein